MCNRTNELSSYETVYLLKTNTPEESLNELIEKYQKMLGEQGAKNVIVQNKGRRPLKYPIKKMKDSVHIQMNYEANGKVVKSIEKSIKINDFVLRYLTIRYS